MSGTTTTYVVVTPSSAEELSALLANAATSGVPVSFEATSLEEELNQVGPRTFTVSVEVMHVRPSVMFEVVDENSNRAFRILIPTTTTGPVQFTIFG